MINNRNYILSALAAALVTSSSVAVAQEYTSGDRYSYEFSDALRLNEKGMRGRSSAIFEELARKTGETDPLALSVLEDVVMQVPGYTTRMEDFVAACPHSPYVPQMYFAYALNLFDLKLL